MKSSEEVEEEIVRRVAEQLKLPRIPKTMNDVVATSFNSGMLTALEWVKE